MRIRLSLFMALAVLAGALFFAGPARCEVKLRAELDRTSLYLRERATLTVTLEGEGVDTRKGVELPELEPHFVIVNQAGPQIQTSMQIINGRFTSKSTWRMAYILEARKVGIFQIPEMVHRVGNRVYRTEPINVEIIEPPDMDAHDESDWAPPSDPYLEARLDRTEAYVGERVVASWHLYNRVDMYSLKFGSYPSLADFKVEELERAGQLNYQTKKFHGVSYNVAFIQSTALFPLQSGKATVGTLELRYEIPIRRRDFFGRRLMQDKVVSSHPLSINVLPLPQDGRPPEFTGAVGNYSISAELDKNRIRALDSLNLTITIIGTGNIDFIKAPKPDLPPNIEVYPPETDTEKYIREGKFIGRKVFKYILVPQEQGNFMLPGVSFSFFDPLARQYRTLKGRDFSLDVEAAMVRPGGHVALSPDLTREEVKLITSDLRYIKPDRSALKDEGACLVRSPVYLGFHALPLLALFAAFYYRKRRDRIAADPRLARSRQALSLAKKRIRGAKKLLDEDRAQEFFSELSRALTNYFADRFQLEAPGLTSDMIERVMKERNIQIESLERFQNLLSLCDQARFGSESSSMADMKTACRDALDVVSELEREP